MGLKATLILEKRLKAAINLLSLGASRSELNLYNIHFYKNAEHKGGEFKTYAGNGKGHLIGYLSERELSAVQLKQVN